jgi:hypothetical protein
MRRGVLLFLLCAAACAKSTSGSSSGTDGGATDDGAASSSSSSGGGGKARAFLSTSLGPGGAATTCGLDGSPFVVLGAQDAPVANGDTFQGHVASVTCSVTTQNGSAYTVDALVGLQDGGSVKIQGPFVSGNDTQVQMTFQRSDVGTFADSACTITYDGPVKGVSPGRVWAHAICSTAANAASNHVCPAVADFLFEDCAQ